MINKFFSHLNHDIFYPCNATNWFQASYKDDPIKISITAMEKYWYERGYIMNAIPPEIKFTKKDVVISYTLIPRDEFIKSLRKCK